jgi:hypothetical protein
VEDKTRQRTDRLFKLGLVFNGQEYCKDDVNVHWTEIACDSDEEFEKKYQKIKEHLRKETQS